jgi:hypothetical protein
VQDPTTRTSTSWDSRSRIATVFHAGELRPAAPGGVGSARTNSAPVASATLGAPPPVRFAEGKGRDVEDLGSKTIDGVNVEGRRTTRIIPAGEQGNDQPMTIVEERWYAPELKITVLQIRDDPRTGTTTMELSDIVPGEPDAALFQVPDGYEIRERTPGQME